VAERGEVREVIPGSYGLEVGPIEWKEKIKRVKIAGEGPVRIVHLVTLL
jgi:hypothetical protein